MGAKQTQITPQQEKFIGLIIAGASMTDAAKDVGINYRTGQRWMKKQIVQAAYDRMKHHLSSIIQLQVEGLAGKAVKVIDESLAATELTSHRIKAAQMILDRVLPLQTASTSSAETAQPPLHGQFQLIDASIMHYLSEQEITTIEDIVHAAVLRKEKADQDRERLLKA